MIRNFDEVIRKFMELNEKIQQISEAVSLMYWDLRTGAPINCVPHRSKAIGTLSTDIYKLTLYRIR